MVERLGDGKTLASLVRRESNGGSHTEGAVGSTLDCDAIVDECLLSRPNGLTGIAELRQRLRSQTRDGDETEKSSGAFVDGTGDAKSHCSLQVAQRRLGTGGELAVNSTLEGETASNHGLLQANDIVALIAELGIRRGDLARWGRLGW